MKVVLVEDNLLLRRTMTALLEKLPCEVMSFSTGEEAIEYFTSPNPSYDVVILDGNLSPTYLSNQKTCNGPDVAAILLKSDKDTQIIPWTDDTDMLKKFQKLFDLHGKGPIPLLAKPVVPSQLRELLTPYIKACAQQENDSPQTRPRGFTIP